MQNNNRFNLHSIVLWFYLKIEIIVVIKNIPSKIFVMRRICIIAQVFCWWSLFMKPGNVCMNDVDFSFKTMQRTKTYIRRKINKISFKRFSNVFQSEKSTNFHSSFLNKDFLGKLLLILLETWISWRNFRWIFRNEIRRASEIHQAQNYTWVPSAWQKKRRFPPIFQPEFRQKPFQLFTNSILWSSVLEFI